MTRRSREQAFWDEHVTSLEDSLRDYERGPDPNEARMLDALGRLEGETVLDFACGGGIVSAWLHDRGAQVTGLDVSAESIGRACSLRDAIGADIRFVTGELASAQLGDERFGRIVGRFALHHVDVAHVAPLLASRLEPSGTAAFLETMATNPLLRLARRRLVGRFGIPRLGTEDERPLAKDDLDVLGASFGEVDLEVAQLTFLRIFDRQVLGYRHRRASRVLGGIDDLLAATGRGSWSYHQVIVLRRPLIGIGQL